MSELRQALRQSQSHCEQLQAELAHARAERSDSDLAAHAKKGLRKAAEKQAEAEASQATAEAELEIVRDELARLHEKVQAQSEAVAASAQGRALAEAQASLVELR
jgi:hypothetical protein